MRLTSPGILRSNHGGGVQWRLCPVGEDLTEACMAELPLPFVGRQYLLYRNGTRRLLKSKYVAADYVPGVSPKYGDHKYVIPGTGFFPNSTCPGGHGCPIGVTLVFNPIPDDCQHGSKGCAGALEFEPPCVGEIEDPNPKDKATWRPSDLGLCQGERPWHVSIVDILRVPVDLKPGEYVLGFRWDAEETAQVWAAVLT
jgi:hypothetical protein